MMKQTVIAAGLAVLLGSGAWAADPENTGTNVRDKDDKSLTVFDQGGSETDRKITAEIRKSIVDDDTLSMNAHNVKIITVDGVVTLRGPVDSAAEKASVQSKATKIAGVKRVDNQLEVDND
jgi:osmotically-inducible protein OsmY